jgi:hypothetical protein
VFDAMAPMWSTLTGDRSKLINNSATNCGGN